MTAVKASTQAGGQKLAQCDRSHLLCVPRSDSVERGLCFLFQPTVSIQSLLCTRRAGIGINDYALSVKCTNLGMFQPLFETRGHVIVHCRP